LAICKCAKLFEQNRLLIEYQTIK